MSLASEYLFLLCGPSDSFLLIGPRVITSIMGSLVLCQHGNSTQLNDFSTGTLWISTVPFKLIAKPK